MRGGTNFSPRRRASTIGKRTDRLAAWLVASTQEHRREIGFWVFLASNALWIAWGWHAGAWALIVLQLCLAGLNIRGARKASPPG